MQTHFLGGIGFRHLAAVAQPCDDTFYQTGHLYYCYSPDRDLVFLLLTRQGSCIIVTHVCTSAMLLVKIAKELFAVVHVNMYDGNTAVCDLKAGPASPVTLSFPLHCLAGNFTVA